MVYIRSSARHPSRIGLVDCNNFYASCERVFNPKWIDRPVGVLSNNDGCIIARSNELKEAGIPMGAPYFKYREQLEAMNAAICSSNYRLYGSLSHKVMSCLNEFTPDMEIYSIDEAWLNLTGFDTATLDDYGRHIVATTTKNTGIPVSLGIAPTKVLAKVANRICKKRKIPGNMFNMGGADHIKDILMQYPVDDLWGIGRRLAVHLKNQSIHTAWDLRESDHKAMRNQYNVVMERIILELRGIPCFGSEELESKKQILASRSFGQKVSDLISLKQAISTHVSRAAEKLRAQDSIAGGMQVFIRSSRHNPNVAQVAKAAMVSFEVPTANSCLMIKMALQALESIYQPNIPYAKAGVMLYDLTYKDNVQASLFDTPDSEKTQSLMNAIDTLNKRFGRHTAFMASSGINPTWQMKRNLMTPDYTTCWNSLIVAR